MKNQAFFSSKDKSKKIKMPSASILFGALKVNEPVFKECRGYHGYTYSTDSKFHYSISLLPLSMN